GCQRQRDPCLERPPLSEPLRHEARLRRDDRPCAGREIAHLESALGVGGGESTLAVAAGGTDVGSPYGRAAAGRDHATPNEGGGNRRVCSPRPGRPSLSIDDNSCPEEDEAKRPDPKPALGEAWHLQ